MWTAWGRHTAVMSDPPSEGSEGQQAQEPLGLGYHGSITFKILGRNLPMAPKWIDRQEPWYNKGPSIRTNLLKDWVRMR